MRNILINTVKVLGVIAALWLLFFDASKIFLAIGEPVAATELIEYYALPLGILFAALSIADLVNYKRKKVFAIFTIVFASIFIVLKSVSLIASLFLGLITTIDTVFQTIYYGSNLLLYAAIILYSIIVIKNKDSKILLTAFSVLLVAYLIVFIYGLWYFMSSYNLSLAEMYFAEDYGFVMLMLSYLSYTVIFINNLWVKRELL